MLRYARTRRGAFLVAVVACLLSAGVAQAYSFFFAVELDRHLEKQVGEQVMVVDKLNRIWEHQEVDGYLRFDTERFRCAIPNTETDAIAYLREVQAARTEKVDDEGKRTSDRTLPLIAIYGTVTREPLWGEVKGGEAEGVVSEQIVIIADKVEKPRARFFDEGH